MNPQFAPKLVRSIGLVAAADTGRGCRGPSRCPGASPRGGPG